MFASGQGEGGEGELTAEMRGKARAAFNTAVSQLPSALKKHIEGFGVAIGKMFEVDIEPKLQASVHNMRSSPPSALYL